MITSEHFAFKNLEMLPIDVVLMFTPRWSTFLVLQAPVNGEEWREHLKLIARHEHLVDLSVARVPIADESFVMSWVVVWCDEKGFVEKLWVEKQNEANLLPQHPN